MTASGNAPDAEIDRLYGLALDEFTPARDELARQLRSEGDRGGAEEVKRLRKPTVAAWALNQVRRRDPQLVDELIAAGQRLADAQQQLLTAGDPGQLRTAAADERSLVEQLGELGERRLIEAGHATTATIQTKLRETLHAVAGNQEARELLRAGRLIRDYQMSDLGLGGMRAPSAPVPAREPRPRPDGADRTDESGKADGPSATEQSRTTDAVSTAEIERSRATRVRRELEQARSRRRKLEQQLEGAERRAQEARRAAAVAAAAAEREHGRAEQAGEQARAAAALVDELEAELSALAR